MDLGKINYGNAYMTALEISKYFVGTKKLEASVISETNTARLYSTAISSFLWESFSGDISELKTRSDGKTEYSLDTALKGVSNLDNLAKEKIPIDYEAHRRLVGFDNNINIVYDALRRAYTETYDRRHKDAIKSVADNFKEAVERVTAREEDIYLANWHDLPKVSTSITEMGLSFVLLGNCNDGSFLDVHIQKGNPVPAHFHNGIYEFHIAESLDVGGIHYKGDLNSLKSARITQRDIMPILPKEVHAWRDPYNTEEERDVLFTTVPGWHTIRDITLVDAKLNKTKNTDLSRIDGVGIDDAIEKLRGVKERYRSRTSLIDGSKWGISLDLLRLSGFEQETLSFGYDRIYLVYEGNGKILIPIKNGSSRDGLEATLKEGDIFVLPKRISGTFSSEDELIIGEFAFKKSA